MDSLFNIDKRSFKMFLMICCILQHFCAYFQLRLCVYIPNICSFEFFFKNIHLSYRIQLGYMINTDIIYTKYYQYLSIYLRLFYIYWVMLISASCKITFTFYNGKSLLRDSSITPLRISVCFQLSTGFFFPWLGTHTHKL